MKIKYGIDDGYAGRDRPHYVTLPDDEIAECETEEEVERLIDETVDDAFRSNVSYYWDRSQLSEAVSKMKGKDNDETQ